MKNTKQLKYEELYLKISSVIENEIDMIAKMANVSALVHQGFGFWWTGFYRVSGEELILGPFQGPVACMHIPYGRGVCGTAWKRRETVVVPDVAKFPGHIACSSASRSEIVVPVFDGGEVMAVLDIDSTELSTFDEVDARNLEKIVQLITASPA
ncbi:MAG: GAF domain-containing protein [Bacteroidales bacterium]|nr:GAF domain-containing protein [Bacteroidales bacterium]